MARPLAFAVVLATTSGCIVLDGCEDLAVDSTAGAGGDGSTTGVLTGASSTSSQGGDASSAGGGTVAASGAGGAGGSSSGGGEGGACVPTGEPELCGNEVDEDCEGGAAACPAGNWWRWLDEDAADAQVLNAAAGSGGETAITGLLDTSTYFVAIVEPTGALRWLRTFTTTSQVLFRTSVAFSSFDLILGVTADGELTWDDGTKLGLPGRTLGLLAAVDVENGDVGSTIDLFPDATAVTSVDAITWVDIDGQGQVLVAGGISSGTLPGPPVIAAVNCYVANVNENLGTFSQAALFSSLGAGGQCFPTVVTATRDQVVVGGMVTGTQIVAAGGQGASTTFLTGFLQAFTMSGDDGQTLAALPAHLLGSGADESLYAAVMEEDHRLHVAVHSDSPEAFRVDGAETELTPSQDGLYLRFTPQGALEKVDALGQGMVFTGLLVEDFGASVLVSGRTGGPVAGLPAQGPFVVELSTPVGEAASALWVRSLSDGFSDRPLLLVQEPFPEDRSFRVGGTFRGDEPIGDTLGSADLPQPYVASFSR